MTTTTNTPRKSYARAWPKPAEPPFTREEIERLEAAALDLDRRTKAPGAHGGDLSRTGLAVYRVLLRRALETNCATIPANLAAIAEASGCAVSTCSIALTKLAEAGLITRSRSRATILGRAL